MSVDCTARALAGQVAALNARSALVAALSRSIARSGRLPGMAGTEAPVLSTSAVNAGSGIAGSKSLYMAVNNGAFTLLRGKWGPNLNQPNPDVWSAIASHYGPDPHAVGGGCTPLIRFWSSAAYLELITNNGAASPQAGYRLRVDGAYVTMTELLGNAATGGLYWQRITWGDGPAGDRRPRLYEIEGTSDFTFAGVALPLVDTVWPAPPADDLRVIVHGDSFVEGSGATIAGLYPALAGQIGTLLGQPDTRGSGVGSTGFISPGTYWPFASRVQQDVIAPAPDVVIELGGLNDSGAIASSADIMATAVTAWLATVLAALPDVLIFMTGPMSPGSGPAGGHSGNADLLAVRDGKKAAAARFPGNVVFIDNIAENWVTGTGHVGGETGDGNADWVTSGDTIHPSDAGHVYLANRVVQAIAGRLALLA